MESAIKSTHTRTWQRGANIPMVGSGFCGMRGCTPSIASQCTEKLGSLGAGAEADADEDEDEDEDDAVRPEEDGSSGCAR